MDLNLIAFYATGRTFSVEFLEETVERFSVKNGKLYYCFMPDPFEVGYARRVIAYDINSGISWPTITVGMALNFSVLY